MYLYIYIADDSLAQSKIPPTKDDFEDIKQGRLIVVKNTDNYFEQILSTGEIVPVPNILER